MPLRFLIATVFDAGASLGDIRRILSKTRIQLETNIQAQNHVRTTWLDSPSLVNGANQNAGSPTSHLTICSDNSSAKQL